MFSAKDNKGDQFATVQRSDLTGVGPTRDPTVSLAINAPVSLTSEAHITQGREGARFFAGFRSDPFFFDLVGFLGGLKFTGADFLADKNTFNVTQPADQRNMLSGGVTDDRPDTCVSIRTGAPSIVRG